MDEALKRLLDQSWDMFLKAPENTRFCEYPYVLAYNTILCQLRY